MISAGVGHGRVVSGGNGHGIRIAIDRAIVDDELRHIVARLIDRERGHHTGGVGEGGGTAHRLILQGPRKGEGITIHIG